MSQIVEFNEIGSKYLREMKCLVNGKADVYAVIVTFDVKCPARQHAIKKLLCSGLRSKGSVLQDLQEARDAIDRAIQIELDCQDVGPQKSPASLARVVAQHAALLKKSKAMNSFECKKCKRTQVINEFGFALAGCSHHPPQHTDFVTVFFGGDTPPAKAYHDGAWYKSPKAKAQGKAIHPIAWDARTSSV